MTTGIDGVFYLSLATLCCGGIGLLIKTCYKIKCSEIDCFCCRIKRDVSEELQIDLESGRKNSRSSLTLGLSPTK
jgi:hypothetical protein